jgi:hypothetical protein
VPLSIAMADRCDVQITFYELLGNKTRRLKVLYKACVSFFLMQSTCEEMCQKQGLYPLHVITFFPKDLSHQHTGFSRIPIIQLELYLVPLLWNREKNCCRREKSRKINMYFTCK